MTTQVILHLGTGKTGTTAIQSFLKTNASLLASYGIQYVDRAGAPPTEGLDYARALVEAASDADYQRVMEQLAGHIRASVDTHTAIYSNETHYENENVLRAYADAIDDLDCTVIVYLRRQDAFIQAHYCQSVLEPHIRESRKLEQIADTDFNPDYYRLLELYERVFPDALIIPRPYEQSQFAGGNIFDDFFIACGLRADKHFVRPRKRESNISRSREFIELLRRANALYTASEHKRIIGALDAYLGTKAFKPPGADYSLLTAAARDDIIARYEPSNRRIAEEFLGRQSGTLFDGMKKSGEGGCGGGPWMSDEEIDRVLEKVLAPVFSST